MWWRFLRLFDTFRIFVSPEKEQQASCGYSDIFVWFVRIGSLHE